MTMTTDPHALVERLKGEVAKPRYQAGDGCDWCEVDARLLSEAAATITRLTEALTGIHQARLHNGTDEGWGWDIGMLNRAMDVALPLIGQPRPRRMSHEERTALRAKFDGILDADHRTSNPEK